MSVLVDVMRGNVSESRHRGFIAIANAAGEVLLSSGPLPEDPVSFFRSAAKPLQAIPLFESGAADRFALTEAEIALACSSHNGEPEHVETVRAMLARAGLSESDLLCGPDYPLHLGSRDELVKAGVEQSAIYNNCSGKHAGMLMACKQMGWPLYDYTKLEHPLQQAILQAVADFCNLPKEEIQLGVDGCSVVCFAVTTAQMATGFARLADPAYWEALGNSQRAEIVTRITTAMNHHPFMVSGSGRDDLALMGSLTETPVFSKGGAEAVWCAGFPLQKAGVALKVEDGQNRAFSALMTAILQQAGYATAGEIEHYAAEHVKPIYNKRHMLVGEYRPAFTLRPPKDWL